MLDAVKKTLVIASDLEEARRLEDSLLAQVSRYGYSDAAIFAIKLALEEALNNAIRHGNGGDPAKTVQVTYDLSDRCTQITIVDQGRGFNPQAVPDPTADENLEKPGGRGIMLMRAYMDEVQYNPRGNEVRMVKNRT